MLIEHVYSFVLVGFVVCSDQKVNYFYYFDPSFLVSEVVMMVYFYFVGLKLVFLYFQIQLLVVLFLYIQFDRNLIVVLFFVGIVAFAEVVKKLLFVDFLWKVS